MLAYLERLGAPVYDVVLDFDAFDWLDRNNDGVLSRTEVVGDNAEQADLFEALAAR